MLEMDGQFDKLEELIYIESHLSNTSAKFYGEITQQVRSAWRGSASRPAAATPLLVGRCRRSAGCVCQFAARRARCGQDPAQPGAALFSSCVAG